MKSLGNILSIKPLKVSLRGTSVKFINTMCLEFGFGMNEELEVL